MKKTVALLSIGLFLSNGVCNTVFADTDNGENALLVKSAKQVESSSGDHSKMQCCDENSDKKIEILAVSSKSNSVKQNFTSIVEKTAFWNYEDTIISYKEPPYRYSGIKQITESVILRE